MSSGFDPYREWLELDATSGSPDQYQLLGLKRFESNSAMIAEAADRAMSRVRGHRPGIHAQAWAQLLDQIAAAKACLSDAATRAVYDRSLGQDSPGQPEVATAPAVSATPNPAAPHGVATINPALVPPAVRPTSAGVPIPQNAAAASPIPGFPSSPPTSSTSTPAPGIQSASPGQAIPVVDPMAPLDPTAVPQDPQLMAPLPNVPNPSVPLPNAPAEQPQLLPGFASVAPQVDPMAPIAADPMAPVAAPIAEPDPVLMAQPAGVLEPVQGVQPAISQLAPGVPNSDGVESPPGAAVALPETPLGGKASVAAKAKSRSKDGIMMPILVGGAVGLLLLMMGGLYMFMGNMFIGGSGDEVTAQTNLGNPAANQVTATNSGTTTDPVPAPEPTPSAASSSSFEPLPELAPVDLPPLAPSTGEPVTFESTMESPAESPAAPTSPVSDETTSPPPQPSRAELVELGGRLQAARTALVKHEFSAAMAELDGIETSGLSEAHRKKYERLRKATTYAFKYHEAIIAATGKLQAGESLRIKTSVVGIVETSADHIIVRVAGTNRRYELTKLPFGLAVALAHQMLAPADPETIAMKACYVMTNPAADAAVQAKALEWLSEAATDLPDVADLSDLMSENYDLIAGIGTPAEMSAAMPEQSSSTPPTREEVAQLAAALTAARAAITAREFSEAEAQLATAGPLAKLIDHKQKLFRLQRLAEHVKKFDEAMKEAVAGLKPGDVIQVGRSTELIVERVNAASLAVEVVGLKKTYPLGDPPLGLAVALVQTMLPRDDPATKAIQAAFVVVSKNSDDRSIAKARSWYDESAEGNPDYAQLGKVIDDEYDLVKDLQD